MILKTKVFERDNWFSHDISLPFYIHFTYLIQQNNYSLRKLPFYLEMKHMKRRTKNEGFIPTVTRHGRKYLTVKTPNEIPKPA